MDSLSATTSPIRIHLVTVIILPIRKASAEATNFRHRIYSVQVKAFQIKQNQTYLARVKNFLIQIHSLEVFSFQIPLISQAVIVLLYRVLLLAVNTFLNLHHLRHQ